MKIGILTYHGTHNYGAFLQAYALCNAIKERTGESVEIINFSMMKAIDENKRIAKGLGQSLQKKRYLKKRYNIFQTSITKYHTLSDMNPYISDNCDDFAKWIKGKYDIIIVGSDEVWALNGYRGFPTPYWLPNVTDCKKMSFAASSRADISTISEDNKLLIRQYLSSFEYIGVRDLPTKELVNECGDVKDKVHINCDPTFLYNFRTSKFEGRELVKHKFGVSGKKKCISLMLNNSEFEKQIVSIFGGCFDFVSLFSGHQHGTKGNAVLDPFEWMEAIAGSDGIITDFFHGTVFAMKNNTPFISFEMRKLKEKKYSKTYDLLNRNGLENHFFMFENAITNSLKEVGDFLANVLAGVAESDFQMACENEAKLSESFFYQIKNKRKHIFLNHKDDCCGCRACENICPKNAISFIEDSQGFKYPFVNEGLCIGCGKCKQVCSFNSEWGGIIQECENEPLAVYGAKNIDETVRSASRSGGAFSALSEAVLNAGGVVYGTKLDDNFLAVHCRATTISESNDFRGSKYIQSDMTNVYKQVAGDLKNGKVVLFSGTPCQIASLRNYLKNIDLTNLYLVDIVCHGVPSPMVWKEYLEYLQCSHKGIITSVDFRNKKFGWDKHRESFVINKKEYDSNIFASMFGSHYIVRPSCFECKFKRIKRPSDITIGDFWGIDNALPDFNDNKGVSLILINSIKGKKLFEMCKNKLNYLPSNVQNCMQNCLRICYTKPPKYDTFWENYSKKGIRWWIKKINGNEKRALNKQQTKRILIKIKKVIIKFLKQ